MTKKKICIIRAGDITYISRIHRAALCLQESGKYDVSIVSIVPRIDNPATYSYKVIKLPIKSRRLKLKLFLPIRILEGMYSVFRTAKSIKADIYMAIAVEDLIIAKIISLFLNIKIVYNANELEGGRKLFNSKFIQSCANLFIRFAEGRILPKISCVIAADYERGKVMEGWYKLNKVEIIRNVPLYQECTKLRLVHEKLSLDYNMKTILYQGILDKGRGLEVSIIAASKVQNKSFALVFLGVIDINYKNTLIKIADDNNFNHLYFIDAVPWQDLLNWTSSADTSLVLIENVSLSYYLAAPNKLYESIMAEVPYIASNFPEIQRVHKIANAGILVDPANQQEITNAIEQFMSNDLKLEHCKLNSKKAKEIFNWDTEKKKLIAIIDKI